MLHYLNYMYIYILHFNFKLLLESSWFAMLCQFQVYSKVNQLYFLD